MFWLLLLKEGPSEKMILKNDWAQFLFDNINMYINAQYLYQIQSDI